MNLKRLVPISLIALLLSMILPIANAEQLKRYKIVSPSGVVLTIVEGYPSVYSTIIFYHDPTGTNPGVCAAGCRAVLDSYQNEVTEGTPTPSATAIPAKANLSALEIELYSISQNDFQWSLNASAGGSRTVLYSNFSYSWNVSGPTGEIDSGKSNVSAISESSVGQIATFRASNLKAGTSYLVSVAAINAGINYSITRTITTKNLVAIPTSDTKTATTQTATKTTTTTTTQSETRTAQVAEVVSISNSKERTVAAVELIKTFDSAEKERALDITYKSTKSTVIDVDLAVPGIPVVVTATNKGSPTITLKSTTDAEGDAQIKTTKNLQGYSVTLTVNKTKIDTDVVKKQK